MNKKSIKLSIFLTVIIAIISLICVPKTETKFIQDGSIVFNANFEKLIGTDGKIDRLDTSTPKRAHLVFEFTRNEKTLDQITPRNKDLYEINEPEKCFILNIETDVGASISVPKGTISFTHQTPAKIKVTMNCEAESLKTDGKLKAEVKVMQKIGKDVEFDYLTYTYEESIDTYPIAPLISKNEYLVDEDTQAGDIYKAYRKWITDYANNSTYANQIYDYVSVIDSEEALIAAANKNVLNGLLIKYNEETHVYTFEASKNLAGYAVTLGNANIGANALYFTTDEAKEVNDALEVYLEKYIYPGESIEVVNQRNQVRRYIHAQGGMSEVVLNNKTIEGFYKMDAGVIGILELDGYGYLLSHYANAYISSKELKITEGPQFLMQETLRGSLNAIDSNIISNTLKENNFFLNVGTYATKNNTDDETIPKKAFIDYILEKDVDHYVLGQVYANGLESENHIEFKRIELLENMVINLINNEDTVDITLNYNPTEEQKASLEEDINRIIEELSEFIPEISEISRVNDESGVITITLSATKVVPNIDNNADLSEVPDTPVEPGETDEEPKEEVPAEGETDVSPTPETPAEPEIPAETMNVEPIPAPDVVIDTQNPMI